MFENIMKIFKKLNKKENKVATNSKNAAKERLHLVLMQDRANVSADFLELMKQEIIEVIKKYIDVDENAIDVRLTNKENGDGTNGAPALYANIPILNIKNEARKLEVKENEKKEEKAKEKIEETDQAKKEKIETEQAKVEEGKDESSEIREINNKDVESNKKDSKEENKIEAKEKIKSED